MVAKKDGVYSVCGDMTFKRASEIFSSIDFSKITANELKVDLSKVGLSDSAALAVMLEWVKQANNEHKRIVFCHIPDQLMQLIEMANLKELLLSEGLS